VVQNIRFLKKKRTENEYFDPQMQGSEASFVWVERIYDGKKRIRFGGKTNKTKKVIEDPRLPEIGCVSRGAVRGKGETPSPAPPLILRIWRGERMNGELFRGTKEEQLYFLLAVCVLKETESGFLDGRSNSIKKQDYGRLGGGAGGEAYGNVSTIVLFVNGEERGEVGGMERCWRTKRNLSDHLYFFSMSVQ
jgi:hypothetical protein